MNVKSKTFCQRLIDSCEKHSQKVAMRVVGDETEVYTFEEMLRQIRSVAYRLTEENVQVGERVAVIGENHPSWAIAYLATLYAGAVCVPLDPKGGIESITGFLEDSEAKVIFTSPDITEKLQNIEEKLGKHIPTVVWQSEKSINGFERFEDWANTEFPQEFAEKTTLATHDDPAILGYTSGTTGRPKGVLLSHGNIAAELDAIDKVLDFTETESVLSLLPLFHIYLQIVNLWLATTKGAEVFYLKDLTPDELSKGMLASKMTVLASVPRLWYLFHKKIFDTVGAQSKVVQMLFRVMLSMNGFTRDYLKLNLGKTFFGKVHQSFGGNLQLAVTAGSRFDEDVAIDFHRLGFNIIQGYGLSETSGAATATYSDDNRVGSVGKAMFGAEVKIDSPNEKGEGEVLIRGSMVFDGYYKNPEATKNAFTEDGWFKSGDLGKFDKDGHLYIVGRAKDVIVLPSGKNVHPEDLEVHYTKSPLVGEICVLGIEDKAAEHKGTEKLVAVVVPDFEYLKQQNLANSKEMIRYDLDNLGRGLPEYQRVRDYVVRSEPIPRTATRKIKRFELQKELESKGLGDSRLQDAKTWKFTNDDQELMSSNAGKAVNSAIRTQKQEQEKIHPDMNLEIDLRLDSLARAETLAALEQSLNFDFEDEKAAQAFSVRELINLTQETANFEGVTGEISAKFNWNKIVSETEEVLPEIKSVLKKKPIFFLSIFIFLACVNLLCKIFLRLDIKGVENLKDLEKPFLICPNHQSFIDPLVVCSAYPYGVLSNTFHVGASQYFQNFITIGLAKLLNIVSIDADTQLLKAMKAGAIGLKHGKILNIYPEGERAFDGELHPFKKGAAILATELDLPIVPVALDGLHKVWARKSRKIRLAKVKIRFGTPIYPKDLIDPTKSAEENHERVTKELKNRIQAMIDEMRK